MSIKSNMLDYLEDPETEKKFKKFLKKEKLLKAPLSKEEKQEIKKLERKALGLWRSAVKIRAKRKCEFPICKKVKKLNAHHIESFTTNKTLRYDLENGICLCPTHHKFGWLSAHRSFCFLYEILTTSRIRSLKYLLENYRIRINITKEFLEETIGTLSKELGEREK